MRPGFIPVNGLSTARSQRKHWKRVTSWLMTSTYFLAMCPVLSCNDRWTVKRIVLIIFFVMEHIMIEILYHMSMLLESIDRQHTFWKMPAVITITRRYSVKPYINQRISSEHNNVIWIDSIIPAFKEHNSKFYFSL